VVFLVLAVLVKVYISTACIRLLLLLPVPDAKVFLDAQRGKALSGVPSPPVFT